MKSLNCAPVEYMSNQPKSGSTIGCSDIDIERRLGGRANASTSTSPPLVDDGCIT